MVYIKDSNNKWLVYVDYHRLNGPMDFQKHCHAFLEMSCVVRGTGTYHVNDEVYDMRPGDVFLFAPTDYHHLELQNETLEHIVIHLEPSFIWSALGNDMDYKFLMMFFQRNARFRCRLDRDNPAALLLNQWFREIWQESQEQHTYYDLMIKIKIQSILAQILRSYDCIDTTKMTRPLQSGELESMKQVLTYIDEHLDSEIRLAELAAIAHVSTSYFSTVFKQYNGLPPVEYVVGRRVRRAIEYIRTTDMTLTEVAMACGFNNSTNFYKAFRRFTGRTPASYRRPMAYDNMPYDSEPAVAPQTVFVPSAVPPAAAGQPVITRQPVDSCADPCGGMADPCAAPCGFSRK